MSNRHKHLENGFGGIRHLVRRELPLDKVVLSSHLFPLSSLFFHSVTVTKSLDEKRLEEILEEDHEKPETIQKYCLIYWEESGLTFEVFDFKAQLRKRLKVVNREDIKFIIKGRPLQVRIEERLNV